MTRSKHSVCSAPGSRPPHPHDLLRPIASFLALIAPVQWIVDLLHPVLLFFHDTVGVGWGMSIVLLTVVVRALLAPLTIKQFKSMQSMVRVAPQLKELQSKHKDDKQRQQQEVMKFYAENKINPFASCLPLLAQMPFFIGALLSAAERPAGGHLRPGSALQAIEDAVRGRSRRDDRLAGLPLHPRPDGQGDRLGAGRADRHVHRLAAAVEPADAVDGRPQPEADHVRAAVRLRAVRDHLPVGPDRLLDHDEPVDRRAGLHPAQARWGRSARRRANRRSPGYPGPRRTAAAGGFMARLAAATSAEERRRARGQQRPWHGEVVGAGQGPHAGREQARPSAASSRRPRRKSSASSEPAPPSRAATARRHPRRARRRSAPGGRR